MLQPLTHLQSLYWQKVGLHDDAFKLERRMNTARRRGHKIDKLHGRYSSVISNIVAVEVEMKMIEGVV